MAIVIRRWRNVDEIRAVSGGFNAGEIRVVSGGFGHRTSSKR